MLQPYTGLLVGQRLAAGSVPLLAASKVTAPTLVTSSEQAQSFFGAGSIAARMARAWFESNRVTPLYMVGVADESGSTAAAHTLTFTVSGSAQAGTLWLYIAGELVQVGVTNGQAQNAIASAVSSAINAAEIVAIGGGIMQGLDGDHQQFPLVVRWHFRLGLVGSVVC